MPRWNEEAATLESFEQRVKLFVSSTKKEEEFLGFAAPSRINVKLDVENTRITRYHEVTNLAIEATLKAPHGGRDTPRTRLFWSIAMVLDRLSDEDWELNKERIGWELAESPVLLLPALLSAEDVFGEKKMMFARISGDNVAFSLKRQCTACPCRLVVSCEGRTCIQC